jgi:hypothetical protein
VKPLAVNVGAGAALWPRAQRNDAAAGALGAGAAVAGIAGIAGIATRVARSRRGTHRMLNLDFIFRFLSRQRDL